MMSSPWQIYWAPEGRPIAIVRARTEAAAIRKAPLPYRRYLGELYAINITEKEAEDRQNGPHHLDRD